MNNQKRYFFRARKEQNKEHCFYVEKVYFDDEYKINENEIFIDAFFETRKDAENWAWRRNGHRKDWYSWLYRV